MTADLLRDAASGRWVAVAAARGRRPGGNRPAEDDPLECPFCAGHEQWTPPETLRLGDGPAGWDVRVVPNKFQAFERHEVVIHGPRHAHSIAELPDATLDLVAEAWQRRAHDAGGTVFAFVNEGWEAGASLPHAHSQLAWLPEQPPAVSRERGLPELLPVLERDGLVAGCPVASRLAYELLVAPVDPEPSGLTSDLLAPALRLLAELVRRLAISLGERPSLNAWLHDGPHWHLELLPRTTRLGGLELGAGVWVNSVPPQDAAERLRG